MKLDELREIILDRVEDLQPAEDWESDATKLADALRLALPHVHSALDLQRISKLVWQ